MILDPGSIGSLHRGTITSCFAGSPNLEPHLGPESGPESGTELGTEFDPKVRPRFRPNRRPGPDKSDAKISVHVFKTEVSLQTSPTKIRSTKFGPNSVPNSVPIRSLIRSRIRSPFRSTQNWVHQIWSRFGPELGTKVLLVEAFSASLAFAARN